MKKKTAITLISILAVLAVAGTAFGIVNLRKAKAYDTALSADYRRSFAELVSGVADVDTALKKSLLVTSPSMAGAVCTEVYGKAQTAEQALSSLPDSATNLEKTAGFVGKVGDYAFALSQKAARGESFTDEERENLRKLSETADALTASLREMQDDLGSGLASTEQYRRTIERYDKQEGKVVKQTLGDKLSASEEEFPEVPTLIYDGPFSDSVRSAKPKYLEGKSEIDESEGRKAAAQFLGLRPETVWFAGEANGRIPSLNFQSKLHGETVTVSVSKQGGVVWQMLSSRTVDHAELSAKEGLEAAKKILERRGFKNMRESYYLQDNNVLTVNFSYVQDGVICYPDLVKVGVALDDGSLEGFDASGYLAAHTERAIEQPAVTQDNARAKIPQDVDILSENLTIIPTAGKNEHLCWEFECQDTNGQKYLIYVNALTGEQDSIFLLLQDENGSLTV
ncbi:MAG: germination protein YpeB [Oscillospiraceae bacterium]|jgi:spore germination protein